MFKIIETVSQANVNHAIKHPLTHTTLMYAYGAAAGLVVGAVARKLGERDLENKKAAFTRKWS